MCMTLQPSRMSGTILYAAETTHNERLLHVMGYQNKAKNLAPGPNAMILPIPSGSPMGPENAIDMRACKNILKDYEKTLVTMNSRRSRGKKSLGSPRISQPPVQVFNTGSYTVVLARDANYINTALAQVPENRRPAPNPAIFQAYSKLYPGWHIALCCYDGTIDAEPMVWQYEPLDPSYLFLPALDGHDGNVPNLAANNQVQRDHTVLVSLVNAPQSRHAVKMRTGSEGKATLPTLSGDVIPETHQHLFGKFFFGAQVHHPTRNGDVMVSIAELAAPNFLGHEGNFKVALPPGA